MKTLTYTVEAQVEESHWWFVGRRKLLRTVIAELGIPSNAFVLDTGTGTGTNLRLLRELGFSNYQGLDFSDEAIRWCAEKQLGTVRKGDVCKMPYPSDQFGLVLATDIIEHVEEDSLALREIRRVLTPDGIAIITVPAFNGLWGLQDEVSHHKRRYSIHHLKSQITEAGLICAEIFYFNYLLFIPIWLARQLIKVFAIRLDSENQLNGPVLNSLLMKVFGLDVWSARLMRPPFGVSICAVVRPVKGD